jgi:GTP pyrophosphokinase
VLFRSIYVPIAHHLGISVLKNRLEDLALMYLNEEEYLDISKKMKQFKIDNEYSVVHMVKDINKRVNELGIEVSIEIDYKHIFSIFRKLRKQDIDLRDLYDAYAIRIIVDSKRHCYEVMGLLHDMFVPVPGRFKDFIAMPKNNLYQAIHTTLISKEKNLFEVQIMTKEMCNVAKYGVLTSWRYKEDGDSAGEHEEINQYEKLHWLNELLKWQQDISNAEFLDYIKKDLDVFGKKMVCMTNKGDVIELPKAATAIDFAFFIDEEKGSYIDGVKVNGVSSDITKVLKDGDIVEVSTGNNITPKSWWLSIIKTQKAKNKLNQILKKEEDVSESIIPKEKYYRKEDLIIYTENGVGVLFNITGVLQREGIDILEIHSKVDNEENVFVKLRIRMPVTASLDDIIDSMYKVDKIREIIVEK